MEERKFYYAACSGGKDSIATVILAREHGEPLDEVVFAEVMFDENTSAEIPEHVEFVREKAFSRFEKWGIKTRIVRSPDKTAKSYFFSKTVRGKREGRPHGFPSMGMCAVQRDCKLRPMRDYEATLGVNTVKYLGIAADEPKRLARLDGEKKLSLLAKYGVTEADAFELCREYDLLSPCYAWSGRGGCFFCPAAKGAELFNTATAHADLWAELLAMEQTPELINPFWNNAARVKFSDWDRVFRRGKPHDGVWHRPYPSDDDAQMELGIEAESACLAADDVCRFV